MAPFSCTSPQQHPTMKAPTHHGRPAICRVPEAHDKGQNTHGKKFVMCCTRQIGVGKEVVCRVPFIEHTAKSLPSAKKHSAKIFSEN